MSLVQEYALAGILAILAYYVAAWWLVGRDPQPGVIFPLFDPPDGFSAAAMRYLRRRQYDGVCAIAVMMQIAVKGHLRIEFDGRTMRVTRREARTQLTTDEEAILGSLLRDGVFELSRAGLGTDLVSGAMRFLNASQELQAQLTKQLAGVIGERRNRLWVIAGGVLSLGWVALVGYLQAAAEPPTVGQGASGAGEFAMGLVIGTIFLNGGMGGFLGIRRTGTLLAELGFLTASLWLLQAAEPAVRHAWWIPVGSTILLGMHIGAWRLLRRPSQEWRLLADRIEGFRMYLETAEGDEIEFLAKVPPERLPPPSSTERIEMLIPYAVALGIELRPGWIWLRRSTDAGGGMPRFAWYEGTADLGDYLRWIGQAWMGIGAAGRQLARDSEARGDG